MKKEFKFLLICVLVSCSLLSCSFKDTSEPPEVEPQEMLQWPGAHTVGVKTYRQVYQQLVTITGLDASNSTIRNTFTLVTPALSSDGDGRTVSATMLLAVTNLTGVFCDQLLRKEIPLASASRRLYQGVDFTKDQRIFTQTIREQVIARFASYFWQREATPEETTIILEAMQEAEMGRPNATAETKNLAVIPCVAAGNSIDGVQN